MLQESFVEYEQHPDREDNVAIAALVRSCLESTAIPFPAVHEELAFVRDKKLIFLPTLAKMVFREQIEHMDAIPPTQLRSIEARHDAPDLEMRFVGWVRRNFPLDVVSSGVRLQLVHDDRVQEAKRRRVERSSRPINNVTNSNTRSGGSTRMLDVYKCAHNGHYPNESRDKRMLTDSSFAQALEWIGRGSDTFSQQSPIDIGKAVIIHKTPEAAHLIDAATKRPRAVVAVHEWNEEAVELAQKGRFCGLWCGVPVGIEGNSNPQTIGLDYSYFTGDIDDLDDTGDLTYLSLHQLAKMGARTSLDLVATVVGKNEAVNNRRKTLSPA